MLKTRNIRFKWNWHWFLIIIIPLFSFMPLCKQLGQIKFINWVVNKVKQRLRHCHFDTVTILTYNIQYGNTFNCNMNSGVWVCVISVGILTYLTSPHPVITLVASGTGKADRFSPKCKRIQVWKRSQDCSCSNFSRRKHVIIYEKWLVSEF